MWFNPSINYKRLDSLTTIDEESLDLMVKNLDEFTNVDGEADSIFNTIFGPSNYTFWLYIIICFGIIVIVFAIRVLIRMEKKGNK